MAGGIGTDEAIVVLPPDETTRAREVAEDLQRAGTRILHRYGPRVLIAELAEERLASVRSLVGRGEVTTAPRTLPVAAVEDLDATGRLGLRAFELRQSQRYALAKARRPHDRSRWDAAGLLPPDLPPEDRRVGSAQAEATTLSVTGTTSEQMTDSVAVGILIVSGPTADLDFSDDETLKVIAEVQNGLGWLAAQRKAANITWNYDIHSVRVGARPGEGSDKEALWRDPAMVNLGYPGNLQGVTDYILRIQSLFGTRWTYVGFFTKYPLDHFAYAYPGGPHLVMQYENDGWGPDNIDRVFAHETCHVFQAPDEYAESKCNCGGSWGIYGQPNGNCVLCAPGGGVACIMNVNDWAMCSWTPAHIGWPLDLAGAFGAITVGGDQPNVFVTASDGNLWRNRWDGSKWSWSNQGRPSDVSLETAMGAITVDGNRPYVYVLGSDRNLWELWWSGSAWTWTNHRTPPGVGLEAPMGAITVDGGRPYVYARGSDGNLWELWWNRSSWSWSNKGTPAGVSLDVALGAITVKDGAWPRIFVKGSDGNVWVNSWNGSVWSWENRGRPPGVSLATAMGAITVDGDRPYVYVLGSDGNLWELWWSGSAWSWTNHGTPAGVSLQAPMGAITVDGGRPYVYARGSDGNLWELWWDRSSWNWSNKKTPAGVTLEAALGAVTVKGGAWPRIFVQGSDGNVWVNSWNGSVWSWSKNGTPTPGDT